MIVEECIVLHLNTRQDAYCTSNKRNSIPRFLRWTWSDGLFQINKRHNKRTLLVRQFVLERLDFFIKYFLYRYKSHTVSTFGNEQYQIHVISKFVQVWTIKIYAAISFQNLSLACAFVYMTTSTLTLVPAVGPWESSLIAWCCRTNQLYLCTIFIVFEMNTNRTFCNFFLCLMERICDIWNFYKVGAATWRRAEICSAFQTPSTLVRQSYRSPGFKSPRTDGVTYFWIHKVGPSAWADEKWIIITITRVDLHRQNSRRSLCSPLSRYPLFVFSLLIKVLIALSSVQHQAHFFACQTHFPSLYGSAASRVSSGHDGVSDLSAASV